MAIPLPSMVQLFIHSNYLRRISASTFEVVATLGPLRSAFDSILFKNWKWT